MSTKESSGASKTPGSGSPSLEQQARLRPTQAQTVTDVLNNDPEYAQGVAGYWNDFIAQHPDFKEKVPFTEKGVKKWAEENNIRNMPSFDRLMLHRDIAETLAADARRPRLPFRNSRFIPDPPASEVITEPHFATRSNPKHWADNHALSDPYIVQKKKEAAAQLLKEGWVDGILAERAEAARDAAAEVPRAEKVGNLRKLIVGQYGTLRDEVSITNKEPMERPPRATPAPAETGELSSKETAERYLDYYDHRDDAPAGPPQIGNVQHDDPGFETGPEGPEAVVDVGDAEKIVETEPVAAPELDLTKVADANVAFEEEEEPKAATPAEKTPEKATAEDDPFSQPDTTPKPAGMENFTWNDYLKDRGEATVESSRFQEWEKDWIRNWGRKYNEMSKTKKIILGATLGATAAAGMAFGSPIALAAGLFGTGLQRISGGLGMFVHAENYLLGADAKKERGNGWFEDWNRQWKTAGAALAYAGLASWGIKHAINYTADWLGHMWPGDVPDTAPGPLDTGVSTLGEDSMSMIPESPQAPTFTVEATQGKGYEFMAKRLWEQLHDPANAFDQDFITNNPDSDAAQLWNAKPEEIDGLVHRLATEHGFYQPDAENVLIKPDSVLGFTPDGEMRLGVPGGAEVIDASPDAPVTPPYTPEPPAEPNAAPEASAEQVSIPEDETGDGVVQESFVTNTRGVPIDPEHARAYPGPQGEYIAYGGSAEERAAEALRVINADPQHHEVVYESVKRGGFLNMQTVRNLMKVTWEGGGAKLVEIPAGNAPGPEDLIGEAVDF